jgi:repressor of nif and glnA expression
LRHHTLSLIESKRNSLNAYQIAAELEKQGFTITDVERQIRQAIYKIKTNILKSHDRRAFEEVILSQIGYGYYIGKNVVIISAEK